MNCQIYIHTIFIFISGDGGYAWEQHGDRHGDGGDRYGMVMVMVMVVTGTGMVVLIRGGATLSNGGAMAPPNIF